MRRRLAVLLALAPLAVVLGTVSLPAYSLSPGPAREVGPLIEVSDASVYSSDGRLILTSVVVERVTAFEAIRAWLDPARAVVSEESILPPGRSEEEESRRAVSEMDQSKIDAGYVVLSQLTGYPEEHGAGALIENVVEGCPADGRLFPGDVIESVGGQPLRDTGQLGEFLAATPAGTPLSLTVNVDGQRERIEVTPGRCTPDDRRVLGVVALPTFPLDLSIASGDIGGPSAGLMWALGLYDLLTPGDLTGGRTVAGTGDIDLDGRVGGVGGIEQKVEAAERAGAAVFVLPVDNLEDARAVADGIRLVPVSTVREAIVALQEAE